MNEVRGVSEMGERPVPSAQAQTPDPGLLADLARDPALRRLSEQLAPLAALEGPVRLFVGGSRPGDGASTIAAALAIDLSQRLAVHTVLANTQSRHFMLKPSVARAGRSATANLPAGTQIGLLPTSWPRLDIVSYPLPVEGNSSQILTDLGNLLDCYQVAVIDLGVIRFDPGILRLARHTDPTLIVARHMHTEREELASTVNAMRATNRRVAGVVLNGYQSPIPSWIRRLLGIGD